MDKFVKTAYERLLDRDYRTLRSDVEVTTNTFLVEEMPLARRVSARLKRMVEHETPIVFPLDRIGFMRTVKEVPDVLTSKERETLMKDYLLFDGGIVCNISSDYEYSLNVGFDVRLQEIDDALKLAENDTETNDLLAMKESIEAIYVLAAKYEAKAREVGNNTLADILKVVPYNGASNYHEALVFFRLMNYALWLNGNKHNTIGRFDQYMYPFYIKDIENGTLTYESAKSLTEELFVTLNYDADMYPGVQQGDNGQSLVLGGIKPDGSDAFNELTKLCLEAALNLKLIDPKINLRVNKDTPMEWFNLGTELTKQGLGFPQYSNDDLVIPALLKLGYEEQDARDYVVAACWEFIIPKVGMDIPNIDALNFPEIVDRAIRDPRFLNITNFDELMALVEELLAAEVKRMVDASKNVFIIPSPFQSVLMSDCVKNRKDIARGGKYNNFGFHGAGLSNASDSLAAIKKNVFEEKIVRKETLIHVLDHNFNEADEIRETLNSAPKMGNNDDYVDSIAVALLDYFGEECAKYKNNRGGIYRAGTGTAMYYIWYSENLGATADGRKAGEPFSANYSPSLNHNFAGVLSVLQSFTKPNLCNVCNGGPLTLEFHDTVFRTDEGVGKVAQLVHTFIELGGHQLQLNGVNRETLLDAQKHPEKYRNLIVRVWGWSGYFNELDLVYQNHIIKRLEFTK